MAAAALLLLLLLPAAVVSSLAPPSIAPSPTAGLTALLLEYSRVLDPVAVSADTALRDELWPQIAAALADDAWHARAPEVLVVAVRAMHLAHQRIVKEMLSRDQSASLSLVDVATAAHEWTAAPLTAVLARYPRAQLDAAGPLGYTALQHAVAATELATIQALLAAGASVHAAPDPLRMTPLHLAARACNHQAVETLLAGGASPLARDAHGRTAVDLAAASWCQMPELGEAEVPGQLLGSMAAASLPSPVAAAAAGPDTVVDGGWRPASRTAASVPSCRLVLQTVQANISLQQFLAAAVSAQRPMVLVNATSAWPLTAALARPALARQFADVDLAVSKIPFDLMKMLPWNRIFFCCKICSLWGLLSPGTATFSMSVQACPAWPSFSGTWTARPPPRTLRPSTCLITSFCRATRRGSKTWTGHKARSGH
jgi:hypothetical protein